MIGFTTEYCFFFPKGPKGFKTYIIHHNTLADSSSSGELHGKAYTDSFVWFEKAGFLFGADPGHADVLPTS